MTAERFSGVKSFERMAGLFLATVMLAGSLTGKLTCITLYSMNSCRRVRQNSVSLLGGYICKVLLGWGAWEVVYHKAVVMGMKSLDGQRIQTQLSDMKF